MKFILVFLLNSILLNSCVFSNKNPVVLQINSQKWTSQQFAKLLAKKIQASNIQDLKNKNLIEKLKEQLIGDLLLSYLLNQWAEVHSITVSPAELKKEIQKLKSSYPSEEVFNLYLKRKNINKKEWKESIKYYLLNKKIMSKIEIQIPSPDPKEIQEYYKSNIHMFKEKSRILIHHIFHEKKEVLIKIEKALKQGAPLEKIYKKFIDEPKIKQPQWVEKGTLAVFDEAFSLKKNEVSPILSSPYAYHIIQVLDKKPDQQLTLEEVKSQIIEKLLSQRKKAHFKKWIDRQSKNLKILKNEEVLKNIKVKAL